jgi:hypothetical protein
MFYEVIVVVLFVPTACRNAASALLSSLTRKYSHVSTERKPWVGLLDGDLPLIGDASKPTTANL